MPVNPSDIIIIIPTHRGRLTEDERTSVSQCERVLGRYTIRFVCPTSVASVEGFEHIPVVHFDDAYFHSVASYNRLMLSGAFYEQFASFEVNGGEFPGQPSRGINNKVEYSSGRADSMFT